MTAISSVVSKKKETKAAAPGQSKPVVVKVPQYKPLTTPSKLVLKKEFSVVKDGKQFQKLAQSELGLSLSDCKSAEERFIRIDIAKGIADPSLTDKRQSRELKLEDPVVSYSLFETENGQARFIAVGCTNKTVFMIIRKDLAYSFVIDVSSLNAQEAVLNLYVSNLRKGKVVFGKTAALLDNFFQDLFETVYDESVILAFDIKRFSGTIANIRLYLDPQNPAANIISVNGYAMDINLGEYPGVQISRGDKKAEAPKAEPVKDLAVEGLLADLHDGGEEPAKAEEAKTEA